MTEEARYVGRMISKGHGPPVAAPAKEPRVSQFDAAMGGQRGASSLQLQPQPGHAIELATAKPS